MKLHLVKLHKERDQHSFDNVWPYYENMYRKSKKVFHD